MTTYQTITKILSDSTMMDLAKIDGQLDEAKWTELCAARAIIVDAAWAREATVPADDCIDWTGEVL